MEFSEKNVFNTIKHIAKWEDLGIQLGFSSDELEVIERDTSTTSGAIIHLIGGWIKNASNASWNALADALRQAGHCKLADSLYCEKFAGEVSRCNIIDMW